MLDEESYNESDYQDLFRKRFIKNWDNLVEPYREAFTPNNYQFIFTLAINVLARLWENQLKSMKFGSPSGKTSGMRTIGDNNAQGEDEEFEGENFGALRFDKDLRGVNSFLSNQTPYGVSVLRDSFARLHQISMLLSVETVSFRSSRTDSDVPLHAIMRFIPDYRFTKLTGLLSHSNNITSHSRPVAINRPAMQKTYPQDPGGNYHSRKQNCSYRSKYRTGHEINEKDVSLLLVHA